MRIQSNPATPILRSTTPAPPPPEAQEPPQEDGFSSGRLRGTLAGACLGFAAGVAGPGALTSFAGLAGGASAAKAAVPFLAQSVTDGLNGDPLNDLALVCSTTFAGGVLLSASAAGAAGLAYPLALALPGAAPVLGAIIGGAAGNYLTS